MDAKVPSVSGSQAPLSLECLNTGTVPIEVSVNLQQHLQRARLADQALDQHTDGHARGERVRVDDQVWPARRGICAYGCKDVHLVWQKKLGLWRDPL